MWYLWFTDFIYEAERARNLKRAPLRCACKEVTRGAWRGSDGDFPLKVQFRAIARPRTIGELPIAIDAIWRTPSWGHSADQSSRQGVQQTSKSKCAIEGYLAHLLLGYTLIVNRFHVGSLNVHSYM